MDDDKKLDVNRDLEENQKKSWIYKSKGELEEI